VRSVEAQIRGVIVLRARAGKQADFAYHVMQVMKIARGRHKSASTIASAQTVIRCHYTSRASSTAYLDDR
jgi:hypothetical protein